MNNIYSALVLVLVLLAGCISIGNDSPSDKNYLIKSFTATIGIGDSARHVKLEGPVDTIIPNGQTASLYRLTIASKLHPEAHAIYYLDNNLNLVRADSYCALNLKTCDTHARLIYSYMGAPSPYGFGWNINHDAGTITSRIDGENTSWNLDVSLQIGTDIKILKLEGNDDWPWPGPFFYNPQFLLPSSPGLDVVEYSEGDILPAADELVFSRIINPLEPGRATPFPGYHQEVGPGSKYTWSDYTDYLIASSKDAENALQSGCIKEMHIMLIGSGYYLLHDHPEETEIQNKKSGMITIVDGSKQHSWTVSLQEDAIGQTSAEVNKTSTSAADITCREIRRMPNPSIVPEDAIKMAKELVPSHQRVESVRWAITQPQDYLDRPIEKGWSAIDVHMTPEYVDLNSSFAAYPTYMASIDAHTGQPRFLLLSPRDL